MTISIQDANDASIIVISAIMSWVFANIFQVIPALVAVTSMIFIVKRHYEDKKKRDAEIRLLELKIAEAERIADSL